MLTRRQFLATLAATLAAGPAALARDPIQPLVDRHNALIAQIRRQHEILQDLMLKMNGGIPRWTNPYAVGTASGSSVRTATEIAMLREQQMRVFFGPRYTFDLKG